MSTDTSRISPTAHYTAYVWYRNGMSHDALATPLGRAFFHLFQPFNVAVSRIAGGLTLERMLLQRHRVIDHLLQQAIESGQIGQLFEVASGLSPRGYRFAERYPQLTVVEGDLPQMAATKERLLRAHGLLRPNHQIVPVNVLIDEGPQSLASLVGSVLDPQKRTAVITEGLLGYFDYQTVGQIWQRLAKLIRATAGGTYYADLHLTDEMHDLWVARIFMNTLHFVTRGEKTEPFASAPQASSALYDAGFDRVTLHRPKAFHTRVDVPVLRRPDVIRVVDAEVRHGDASTRV